MKYIVILADGMADEPVKEFGNKTPLEAAHTPNMDYMAGHGMAGLVKTIPDGVHPGSDIGNMAILGYDPTIYHTGRAPLEAANMNIVLGPDEVAFRCNLITTHEGAMKDYSAGHISTKEADELIAALNRELGSPDVRFHTGKSYRHLMVLKTTDPQKFRNITTVAPHDILNKKLKDHLPKGPGAETLLRLMEKSKSIFESHPINQVRADLGENPSDMIWLWGQGVKPQLPAFEAKYGIKGGIISAVDLVCGIGRLASLEVIDVPGITGYYDTNFQGKAEYALASLERNDFVYIHVEAPDEAGHNGDFKAKSEAIANIDKHIVGAMLNRFGEHDNARILVLPDHPTPVRKRTHTADPVGFVMYGKGIAHNGCQEFTEKAAAEKGMKFTSGGALMEYFIKKHLEG